MSLADIQPLEMVTERDIDLLVMEELQANDGFLEWFLDQIGLPFTELLGIWHSVSHTDLGESDLVLPSRSSGRRLALLIENKINAPAQPDQAQRYALRGKAGKAGGDWEKFTTFIIAPKRYLETKHDAAHYDYQVSYEAIRDWFADKMIAGGRKNFKLALINNAIEQNRRGYVPLIDECVTRFFSDYWNLAQREFPELEMRHLPEGRPSNSEWAEFFPPVVKKAARRLYHKVTAGKIDLELSGMSDRLEELSEINRGIIDDGIQIVRTGKSVVFRCQVTGMNHRGIFTDQIDIARLALKSAYRLMLLSKFICRP